MTQSRLEMKEARNERPKWEEYWIDLAEAVMRRSTDEDCQVGAVIVRDNVLISTGYNGLARGVQHHEYRTKKAQNSKMEKLRWMCHAEQNAIFNAARLGVSVEDATIYTTKFPCLICTNAIVQAGIKLIYTTDKITYDDEITQDDGRRVFCVLVEAGVRLIAPNFTMTPGPMEPGPGNHGNNGGVAGGLGRRHRGKK
jgi:dCMP deaminase